jgi:hypothetical protein
MKQQAVINFTLNPWNRNHDWHQTKNVQKGVYTGVIEKMKITISFAKTYLLDYKISCAKKNL